MHSPTIDQVAQLAGDLGIHLDTQELKVYRALMDELLDSYRAIGRMDDGLPRVTHPRTPGWQPDADANPHNAWYRRTEIVGRSGGRLSGKRIALKDNILLAGVPMMNGCATLEGYVPDVDATLVTRILDEGGTIVGKATCESLCLSGGSHTSATGPVSNPYNPQHTAGGSSSGCAVIVAMGAAEMAVGCDQGGSIRMPAACCGVYGMKPTYGLVPYTGIMPIEVLVDHAGPITSNVLDNALLLNVIAGGDGFDPRQRIPTEDIDYVAAAQTPIGGLRIGLLREGFDQPDADRSVVSKVQRVAERLASMGASVTEVSVPLHRAAPSMWMPLGVAGLTQTLMFGDGFGTSREDLYIPSLMRHHHNWRHRADALSTTTKVLLMLGTYVAQQGGAYLGGKAINLTRTLRHAYDQALRDVDLLLMPTFTVRTPLLPPLDAPADVQFAHAVQLSTNTMPFNLSHHPAMSIPCGMIDDLPVGAMLVGRAFEEAALYRAAYAFEQETDWRSL